MILYIADGKVIEMISLKKEACSCTDFDNLTS